MLSALKGGVSHNRKVLIFNTHQVYYVSQTVGSCESARKVINITINQLPTPTLVPTQPTCNQNNGSITANVTGGRTPYTFLWSNTGTTATINNLSANTTTTFFVTVTDANSCTAIRSISLTCVPLACSNTSNNNNVSLCEGSSYRLPKGNIITVSTSQTVYRDTFKVGTCDSIIVTNITVKSAARNILTPSVCGINYRLPSGRLVAASGIYLDTLRNAAANGCDSIYTVNLMINSLPITSVSSNPTTAICVGQSVQVKATGGANYRWSNGKTTDTTTVIPLSTTTYTVTVTNATGCSKVDEITITVNATPSVPTANDVTYCQNQTASPLRVTGTVAGLLWYTVPTGGTGSSTAPTPSTTTVGTTTYYVSQAVGSCESTRKAIVVTINQPPTLTLVPTQPTCNQNNGAITASVIGGRTPYSFLWSNTATTATINNISANTPISVTVTDADGCIAISSVSLPCVPLACTNTSNNNNVSLCEGSSYRLPKGGIITVSTNQTVYRDTFKVGTCDSIIVTNITVKPAARNTLSVSVCGINYRLPSGRLVTVSGIYLDTLRNAAANGCDSIYTVNLTVNPLPTPDVRDTAICQNTTASLWIRNNSTNFRNFQWLNNPSTTAVANYTPSVSTTYFVTVTDANGCQGVDSAKVTVNSLPTPDVRDTAICQNTSASLWIRNNSTSFRNFQWLNNSSTTAVANYTPSVSSTYFVTVTDANGCKGTDSAKVTVNPLPTPDVRDTAICQNTTASLWIRNNSTSFRNFQWLNNSSTTAVANYTPSVSTTYFVTVTDANGCKGTDSAKVTVNPLPITVVSSNPSIAICLGQNVQLKATGGTTYKWSNGKTTDTTTLIPLLTTTYTVTVTNAIGCSKTDAITITVFAPPSVNFIGNTAFCTNSSTTVTATGGGTYLWDNNSTNPSRTFNTKGTYSVTVTNSNNCSTTKSVVITEYKPHKAVNDSVVIPVNQTKVPFDVIFNDIFTLSPYNPIWRIEIPQKPKQGTLTPLGNGQFDYETEPNQSGLIKFIYQLYTEGCPKYDSATVTLTMVDKDDFRPDAFTPNGDGVNDVLIFPQLDKYPNNELEVLNRWGAVVYSAKPYDNTWEGTNRQGQGLPEGTYYYILRLNINDGKVLRGDLLIVR